MKIKENLVYDKYSGQLVGYVDLGDPETNYASFEDPDSLATRVLVFYIRGLASYLKFELGYFFTIDVTAHQLMMQFWKAVAVLEDTCNLHVVTAVSDEASSNRAFYRIHQMMDTSNKHFVYRTINLYSGERYIWFFADAPHLMKTTRNCMYNSAIGKSRYMWNSGKDILWSHISRIAYVESNRGLKLIIKITDEHVRLTPYSKMNGSLATQVSRKSFSSILMDTILPKLMVQQTYACMWTNFSMSVISMREFAKRKILCYLILMKMMCDLHGYLTSFYHIYKIWNVAL